VTFSTNGRPPSSAPWFVEETDACFAVRDRAGQPLAYVYFEDGSGRRSATHPFMLRGTAHRSQHSQAAGFIA
jgi:hypothetical protein